MGSISPKVIRPEEAVVECQSVHVAASTGGRSASGRPPKTGVTGVLRFAARPPRGALGSIPRPLAPSAPVGVPWPDHPAVSLAEDDSHNTHPKGKPTSSATPNKKESWRTIAFTALTADWVNVLRHDPGDH